MRPLIAAVKTAGEAGQFQKNPPGDVLEQLTY